MAPNERVVAAPSQVAQLFGADADVAEGVHFSCREPSASLAAGNARVAAGLCLARLVCEGDLTELEEVWGEQAGVLKKGELARLALALKSPIPRRHARSTPRAAVPGRSPAQA